MRLVQIVHGRGVVNPRHDTFVCFLRQVFERRPTLSGQTRLRTAVGWISERSREGKQLVESVLSDDSDDDDEIDADSVLGPW